ncbi:hypothetical protein E0485_00840 [Paenibacillus albiflavus]|uniref:DUF4375 domain-containing protein n=1 Tax=Paenibacillus albiflavus TaxID=2545760 RepID=A0A4R4EQI9_9BACL|nr:hypothetical protein [Paenibacillus albiflavus]TCZ80871.1 hypothetical protein E0485_00840 [Paenibacillus albiflavus]
MITTIKQNDLKSNQLSWLCIEPMLLAVRGKDFAAKTEMYKQLNEGQQALYLFYAFHNHVNSTSELYWFAAYYITEMKAWDGIIHGLRYFKDLKLIELLEQVKLAIEQRNKVNDEWSQASPTDLDKDEELRMTMQEFYTSYQSLSTKSINQMNQWIINHPEEYFVIE